MRRLRKKKTDGPRLFAWVVALVLALASLPFAQTRLGLWLEFSAALVFAIGTVWPRTFRGCYGYVIPPLGRLARRAWFL